MAPRKREAFGTACDVVKAQGTKATVVAAQHARASFGLDEVTLERLA